MSSEQYVKVQGSPDDLNLDTPGHGGTAPNTFTRTLSDGTVGNNPATGQPWPRFSADAVPHRDEAVIAGARQPHARVATASRFSEQLAQDTRINVRDMKNFEHYGGVAGSGVSAAVAARNTQVWDKILADMSSEGRINGVFFPGTRYEFMEWAGTPLYTPNTGLYALHILPIKDLSGVSVVGSGGGTTIAASVNANNSFHLFYAVDSSSLTFQDMTLEKQLASTNGNCIRVESVASNVSNLRFNRLTTSNGISGAIRLDSNPGFVLKDFWINECNFGNDSGAAVFVDGCSDGYIEKNIFTGTNTGIVMSTGDEPLNNIKVLSNILTGTMNIQVSRFGTYDGTIHKDFTIDDNVISDGDIFMGGVNEWLISRNTLFDGGLNISFGGMTGAHNLAIKDNYIEKGTLTGGGIAITGDGVIINGLQISGGRINNASRYGIDIQSNNGIIKVLHIHDLAILNNSREDTGATTYSSIRLHETTATGGIQEASLHNLILRNTALTPNNSNKQTYGIEMTNNGGLSDRVLTNHNFIKGYVTSAILLRGANSASDEPAAWDGGASV